MSKSFSYNLVFRKRGFFFSLLVIKMGCSLASHVMVQLPHPLAQYADKNFDLEGILNEKTMS